MQHFQTSFPQKTLDTLKPNFMWSLHGMLGWKFIQMVLVTWPRWLPDPYMVKTLKKSPSSEPKGRWPWNLVCSIGYSSTTIFFFKWWPWVDFDLFYSKVKLGPFCFFVFCNKGAHIVKKMSTWQSMTTQVKVIHWPLSSVTKIQHFETSFPQKH